VLSDLRDWTMRHLAAPGAILVIDATGDLKKGTADAQ
jgi:SRSO17 transposase